MTTTDPAGVTREVGRYTCPASARQGHHAEVRRITTAAAEVKAWKRRPPKPPPAAL